MRRFLVAFVVALGLAILGVPKSLAFPVNEVDTAQAAAELVDPTGVDQVLFDRRRALTQICPPNEPTRQS